MIKYFLSLGFHIFFFNAKENMKVKYGGKEIKWKKIWKVKKMK